MHLLAAQAGELQQEGEAIDLGQSPADLIFASAADSELSALAGAVDRAGTTNLRLANILRLAHNMSVDLWLDQTVSHAKLVVVRLLGGPAYWPYGVAELETLARQGKIKLALLPGDANPDPLLLDRSTIDETAWHKLHALFVAGGPDNMALALTAFTAIANDTPFPNITPAPFPRFGLWWPGEGIVDAETLADLHKTSIPQEQGEQTTTANSLSTTTNPAVSLPLEGRDAGRQGGGQPEGLTKTPENRRLLRPQKNIARARELRNQATPPEQLLWNELRAFKTYGAHFRRQVPIGPYFADFACHNPKLVIELDGDSHSELEAQNHDARRTDFLVEAGYRVVRFSNGEIIGNIEGVWDTISAALTDLSAVTPTPDPSPQGGEEQSVAALSPSQFALACNPIHSLPPEGRDAGRQGGGQPEGPGKTTALNPAHIPILFYRAALEGAGTATLNRLIKTLVRAGLAPVPMVISTLKEGACLRFAQSTFKQFPPEVILNLTGFALGLDGIEKKQNPFAETDAPVLQLIQASRPEELWEKDIQGLTAKDLAMQLVMPELDGRIGGLIIGHKEEANWHEATECPLSTYAPDADGINRAVKLTANWTRLRRTKRANRKVALVLANYPIRDGRIANGVGYDAPQSTVEIMRVLAEAGYTLGDKRPLPSGARSVSDGTHVPTPTPNAFPQGGGEHAVPEGSTAQLKTENSPAVSLPLEGRDAGRQGGGQPEELTKSLPTTGNALIEALQRGPTNANPTRGTSDAILPLATYRRLFATLPDKIQREVTERWGDPADDPFVRATPPHENRNTLPLMGRDREGWSPTNADPARRPASPSPLKGGARGGGRPEGPTQTETAFHLPVIRYGSLAILLQPARGYDRDAEASYHDPDLVPPHAYLAAYLWLQHEFAAHALIHNGKHGNLEWLPGKATALDAASYPLALWGALPHLYPFIVNDPGEGTQAKRRTGAVIIDHLVPPLTRAETYGPLKDLEALLDEYYAASGMDRRRLEDITKRILAFTRDTALDRDIDLPDDEAEALNKIDTFLCDLKEAQIRDGLHIFGQSPKDGLERDLIVALARVPRGENTDGEASLIRAIADDLKLGFDPLTAKLGDRFQNTDFPGDDLKSHPTFQMSVKNSLNTCGDVVECLEHIAASLVTGTPAPPEWQATRAVLETVETIIRPRLAASGPNEVKALLNGLDGKFIAPGSSGAPSRGRLDVLPTGRNFYSVDNRAIPTPTAWELGKKSAENLIERHYQDHGNWLQSIALSAWGTANMRTGGDDIAQAMALIGARPKWDPSSLRVSGYEIIPLAKLGRPRVDVTLRISGFFRDAFPLQIALFDKAIRAIGSLDEPVDQNPIAARMRTDALGLVAEGQTETEAGFAAGHRIFGSKPGAYGAGLQGLMDSGNWKQKQDLAKAFLNWGHYAYGAHADGKPEYDRFKSRLANIEAVVHNQDNREHDLLDSDDYYQFEGGLTVASEVITGNKPLNYHNDHSRPERPVIRTLEEEISKVMRSRVVNPKWISGVMRHGYKGAFEIIATVDYMFAFAATTGAVKTHHFDLAFDAYIQNETVKAFIQNNNPYGYAELLAKFREAIERGFWTPKSNSAYALLEETAHD